MIVFIEAQVASDKINILSFLKGREGGRERKKGRKGMREAEREGT